MKNQQDRPRSILHMNHEEARKFLLKPESFCDFDLPRYFDFSNILTNVNNFLTSKNVNDIRALYAPSKPRECEGVNYIVLQNKDGKYAWRPYEIIHPALYCSLVNTITQQDNWEVIINRFKEFNDIENIDCAGLPVEASDETKKDREAQISEWWREVEQKSIELSLEYEFLIHTDITNCYGQIYTHSIAWSIHGKKEAKDRRRDKNLIGNKIDKHIQDMRFGQTNGIPQGSVLMDFIAEMIFGYMDLLLNDKLTEAGLKEYKILRYRDDYKIFVHNTSDGEKILKALTEVMIELGFHINPYKTRISHEVIRTSIKADKLAWLFREKHVKGLQERLLIIHDHALSYPNSGILLKALADFKKRLSKVKKHPNAKVLISIVVDIATHNPRTYPICAAILSQLLVLIEDKDEKRELLKKIAHKLSRVPNVGYLELWLQRIALPQKIKLEYNEPLCRIVSGDTDSSIWNNTWIESKELRSLIERTPILGDISEVSEIIPPAEVELFLKKSFAYR